MPTTEPPGPDPGVVDVERGRRRAIGWVTWTTAAVAGAVAVEAAVGAARYVRGFPDGTRPCELVEACTEAQVVDALSAAWWTTGTALAVAVAALFAGAWSLSSSPVERPLRPRSATAQAVATGVAGALVCFVGSAGLLFALFASAQMLGVAFTVLGLLQAVVVHGVDSNWGPGSSSPRRSWLTAMASSTAATVALTAVATRLTAPVDGWWLAVAIDALVLAGAVLALRLTAGRSVRVIAAGALCVGLLTAACAAWLVTGLVPDPVTVRWPAGPVARPPSQPDPEPVPPPSTPAPAPATSPPPRPVVLADVPCDPAVLSFLVPGFDGAMGARAASVQATNTGDRACWVEGAPVVTLLQGGTPLQLTVTPATDPSGGPAVAGRIGLAPGDRAVVPLSWRTYGGWADDETPQSLTVALVAGAPPVDVPFFATYGPAPFDIADGGAWQVGAWALPSA
ncbi:DUF4232 domain-containing protein [Modestobacter sp. I12A-02628]|uniref:DUF4232 domain-containing protein n=1 Tax=Goekera deserti TaxID=2497753 RepID=A0A7K3WE79_9ACTN|nr:DUF4232 domain-containing protein [Goekera deserti]MPQ98424.1 DUF4232 domain-containing protein [Goekera deserti]NDI48251.1 DUF4232 domain-containing protein [Goekera deserti]NEL54000.1 DUF4232 domain-containing protein [Goekera deserti]